MKQKKYILFVVYVNVSNEKNYIFEEHYIIPKLIHKTLKKTLITTHFIELTFSLKLLNMSSRYLNLKK